MTYTDPPADRQRIRLDKWLWAARLYKTRSLAAQAIDAGHVKVAGQRCKPAREARIGELLEVCRGAERTELVIRALSAVRGAAPQAQQLYEETAQSLERKAHARALRAAAGRNATAATERPTKRDRRQLDRWRAGA
ncbi:MAG TPA: S4 domain-containing protein [Rhodocyclaceae bacterium]|nr:S4 domain-containing protein [Rhodocyclaceae bacterium]